jgi:hypothetical protein
VRRAGSAVQQDLLSPPNHLSKTSKAHIDLSHLLKHRDRTTRMRGSRLWAAVWTGASLSVLESLVMIIQVHTSTNRNLRSSPVAVFPDDVLFQPTTKSKNMASKPKVRRAVQREEVVEVRDGGAKEKKESRPAATAKMTTPATAKSVVERGGVGVDVASGDKEETTPKSKPRLAATAKMTTAATAKRVVERGGVGVGVDADVASGDKEETTLKSKPKYRMVSREQALAAKEKRQRLHEQQRQQLHQQKDDDEPPRFSYAFLIGGVHEDNPGYRGFLYNVMIATRILRDHNSTADVNLMIQFAHQSKWVAIPEDKAVRSMSINIVYLKRPKAPLSFADIQLQKFKILQWTQYDRVLFLDADIMPNKSLDYLFQLSMEGILKENVVVATRGEPANGGFWMVKPQRGDVEKMEVILRKHAEPFDRVIGWGHSFAKEKDKWESTTPRWMPRWRFWAAHLDQGLLYCKWVERMYTCCGAVCSWCFLTVLPSLKIGSSITRNA